LAEQRKMERQAEHRRLLELELQQASHQPAALRCGSRSISTVRRPAA
jgi:hypothetical protein